ncbi:hypothetical protein H5410_014887 [Solanum commersonii]|uniref:Uncharacterized protein n=1 Tax=Solanum commersonii TaxID=4109 RepID=A0A9J5ZSS9_SOLCO|nr:hypothetical protein H5410_014887 [Solanum commersonii]
MIRSNDIFEPHIKYLDKLWTSPENSIKNNVVSTTPPLEEITLPIKGKVIIASHFKMDIIDTKGDPIYKDINKILQKNNYTNQLLYLVSNQILRADNKPNIKDKPSSSYKDKNKNLENHPIFKFPEFSKDKFPNFQEKLEINDELIGIINEKSKSKALIIPPKRIILPFWICNKKKMNFYLILHTVEVKLQNGIFMDSRNIKYIMNYMKWIWPLRHRK